MHASIEVAKGAKNEEHVYVGGSVIHGRGNVRDEQRRISGTASVYIYLVIASAYSRSKVLVYQDMPVLKGRRTAGSNISQGAWQRIHQLLIDLTGDAKRVEGTIGSDHSLECSPLALFQEFFTGDRSRLYDLGNPIQSIPGIVRAEGFLLASGLTQVIAQ